MCVLVRILCADDRNSNQIGLNKENNWLPPATGVNLALRMVGSRGSNDVIGNCIFHLLVCFSLSWFLHVGHLAGASFPRVVRNSRGSRVCPPSERRQNRQVAILQLQFGTLKTKPTPFVYICKHVIGYFLTCVTAYQLIVNISRLVFLPPSLSPFFLFLSFFYFLV